MNSGFLTNHACFSCNPAINHYLCSYARIQASCYKYRIYMASLRLQIAPSGDGAVLAIVNRRNVGVLVPYRNKIYCDMLPVP
ncbi:hypothetical protein BDZ91DRAFT_238025 [Kalaharituber pfeilii]|nr:hypothetical protein BDZ91DRAFT_238025 [Kalaharituber pfeilii]